MNTSTVNNSSLSNPNANSTRLGWTGGPNNRGTIDIIWNCAITMFLCCWSILIVNVPNPGSSFIQIQSQKFYMLCLCGLAPEIVFQIALGQFLAAKRSRAAFRAAGYQEWGLRHSFYVNMGALHLKTPGFKSFPIDADQLLYLIQLKYVEYPQINEDAIRDKNKIDGMLRFITLTQAMWFFINLTARAVQNLAISCIELSTSAWVIFCLGITICWSKKPADVEFPEYIETKTKLADILKEGGHKACAPYYNTPLDFINRNEWPWSKLWHHGLVYLRSWRIVKLDSRRPIQRFGDTVGPAVEGWWYMLFGTITISYFAVFIAAWNFSFPTPIERLIWRIAAIAGPFSAVGMALSMHCCMIWYPNFKEKHHKHSSSGQQPEGQPQLDEEANNTAAAPDPLPPTTPVATKDMSETTQITPTSSRQTSSSGLSKLPFPRRIILRVINGIRNNSTSKDPQLDCPLRMILFTWFFGLWYCFARGYIAIEDLMELRSLPASSYDTVDWTKFWPHV